MSCIADVFFVIFNDEVISSGSNISSSGNSSISSNSQSNTVSSVVNNEIHNSDLSNHSKENKNVSTKTVSINSFSSSGISKKNNRIKKQPPVPNNNALNNLVAIKKEELVIHDTSMFIIESESESEGVKQELVKIVLINPVLITNNNVTLAGNNFTQIKKTKKSSRWSSGITYLPLFTNRNVSYDLQNSNPKFIDDTSFKRKDENLFSNNFGVDVYYSITTKFYLHSGLYSITYGEESFYDNKVYQDQNIIGTPFTTLSYADYTTPGSEQQRTNKYSFIQVPLNVGMKIRTGTKTSLNIETGFAYGYLVKTEALEYITINDTIKLNALDDAQLSRMNRNVFFANASISFDWHFIKNLSWGNGFMAQYQLTDLYRKNEIQSQHNYGFGLQTSLIFHFK